VPSSCARDRRTGIVGAGVPASPASAARRAPATGRHGKTLYSKSFGGKPGYLPAPRGGRRADDAGQPKSRPRHAVRAALGFLRRPGAPWPKITPKVVISEAVYAVGA
jgi:hypothetical protein